MKFLKKLWSHVGPGFITGASDDDPSGIATYSQTGAQFGYSQLWTSFFTIPFMIAIQEICGRIGIVTGKGIAKITKKLYPRQVVVVIVMILLVANVVNIGADLGAMASAGELLLGIPFWEWLVGIVVINCLLIVFIPYKKYAQVLKYLTFFLLIYVFVTFAVNQDWSKILYSTIVPNFSFSRQYIMNIVAILGTTISPYLFFWQADEEVEEEVMEKKLATSMNGKPKFNVRDIRNMRLDTAFGMVFSNVITFFIIATTASTLHVNGITNIETATQAAEALRPIAGNLTFILFALGILGTGFLAVPVLGASASYAVSESFGWKTGLFRKFKQAPQFYLIIIGATILGAFVNFLPIKPFQLLYYTAILNGVAAPPLMILIMLVANNKKVMGENRNGLLTNIGGWGITIIMSIASIVLLVSLFI